MRKAVGLTIKHLRERQKLSQQALAERLGVVRHTVGRWEQGRHFPPDSVIQRLPEVLGIPVEELEAELERQLAIALRKREAPARRTGHGQDDYPPIPASPSEIAGSSGAGGRWIRVFVPAGDLDDLRRL